MRKSKLDLAKRLNRSRKRKYDKFLTSSLYLTIILVLCYLVYLNLPWSFHLFYNLMVLIPMMIAMYYHRFPPMNEGRLV
ncbi:MAG: hypothetical protein GPJ17_20220 [Microcystis aeruginosa K13-07]|nr:hypothetical protein [Microcystis aeruginosa K13-07]